ncbi:helicase HerA-like C-terminal domain-containing protein [Benzoatithermus flavus]|uniref:Helicase HerA-like C-terminal domain-containing protein n=1 Tax=Benzoatithermus flavus TaxID=3108223 RepID=A0ABU8XVH6_9PROT
MDGAGTLLIGKGEKPQYLHLPLANRHGLVAGATGTGKTVTLQVLAEGFSRAGVPVFCADVKGDLSGLGRPGAANPKIEQRAAELGIADFAYEAAPVVFWDLFGEEGHPVRATVAEMGPLLLARMLELNDTQEGVLNIAFKLADDEGLLLLDFKDLTAMLQAVAERADELTTAYGNVGKATIGTIQRRLLTLEQQGAEHFFGEPALELTDLMLTTPDGRGAVNVLMADRLIHSPRLYATFLLWLLAELFEELPEAGDLDKPKLVFFFDEAHLLFKDAPKALVEKVEQVVRLIRSKGVGVYFVTQNPADVPPAILGQLGNRVQHALRAFTPVEQKGVRAAAETFRPNPKFETEEAITQLGVGEALVSTLEPGGVPGIVERVRIAPPRSRIGSITPEERRQVMATSPLAGKYDAPVDRESAYERLRGRATTVAEAPAPHSPWGAGPAPRRDDANPWGVEPGGTRSRRIGGRYPAQARPDATRRPATRYQEPEAAPPAGGGLGGILGDILTGGGKRQSVAEAVVKSAVRSMSSSVGRQVGNAIVRGILGSILKR